MANPFDHFGTFLFAVGDHLFTLLAGCVVTVILAFLNKYGPLKGKMELKTDLGVLLLFVLFACFQAWHDEYKRAEAIIHPVPPASIVVNLPQAPPAQIVFPPSTPARLPTKPVAPITYRQFPIKPTIGLQDAPSTADGKTNPGVEVVVTAEEEISYPTFEAVCDRPCTFSFGLAITEATKFSVLSSNSPNVAKVEFVIPAVWSRGKQIAIDYRSKDATPISIKRFRLIKDTEGK